ncbi:hypothetical protein NicSoilB4_07110 [Arthrobacter sp. NicSoilB4]|nr:hypothetical protein NicSoilB4_07110 [Arthrobacter sp. NicSoilB4]
MVRDLPHHPNASMATRYTTTMAMLTKLASIKGSSELFGAGLTRPALNRAPENQVLLDGYGDGLPAEMSLG